MIWTPMPLETVLEGWGAEPAPTQEVHLDGRIFVVEMLNSRQYRLVRLISPNAADYLQPQWQPGRTLTLDWPL